MFIYFQAAYKQLSGRALPVQLYKKALVMAIVIPILSTTSVIVTHITMVHFKAMQLIPYVFLEILTYLLGGYWYLLCETLSVCANILAEDFQQVNYCFKVPIPRCVRCEKYQVSQYLNHKDLSYLKDFLLFCL